MKLVRILIFALMLALFAALHSAIPPSPPHARTPHPTGDAEAVRISEALLETKILSQPWANRLTGISIDNVKLVQPRESRFGVISHKAWIAQLVNSNGPIGYLLWDWKTANLIEFALDTKLAGNSADSQILPGVPALQQFPVKGEDGSVIASGCVPTSAASIVGYWITHGQPQWRGTTRQNDLPEIARRLRSRLHMIAIPDDDGFTDNGMTLAGAFPNELASALRADAKEMNVPVVCGIQPFSIDVLKSEITAGRPVLLSCGVRLPQKPELSWGHEVAGVGWTKIGDITYIGVLDNFYPTQYAETIRWISQDAFSAIITIKPENWPFEKTR